MVERVFLMSQATSGDTVHVHYTGKLGDGSVFDSSEGRDPLSFELGKGMVVPGFEKAVTGMEVGEKKTVTFPSEEAYGPRLDQLTFTVPRDNLPEGYDPKKGEMLRMETRDGRQMDVLVTGADEKSVKLDANHPLAGHDLTFDVELVKID
jgi:FKBP-type peptidyl-prolyl cis-trans isomerase 2